MAVRQYIGARYTTKIYENSQNPGSAEWEAGATYEPLTLVTYLNSSYLSKKEVPGNVGNPAANPQYWIVTGAYNGQIASLQNQINTINNTTLPGIQSDIDTLNNTTIPGIQSDIDDLRSQMNVDGRKFVIICDSYGGSLNSDNRNFYTQSFYELGVNDYYDFHIGGGGFCRTDNRNFLTLLQNSESVISDKDEITDVIVLGGANDQVDPSGIEASFSAFVSYVKTNYPNAKISVGHFTNDIATLLGSLRQSINIYRNCCSKYGARYIDNSEYIMAKLSFFNGGGVHPSETGNRALTKYFNQYLIKGQIDVYEKASGCFSARATGASIIADRLIFIQHNGIVEVEGASGGVGFNLSFSPALTVPQGENGLGQILTAVDGYLYAPSGALPCFNCLLVNGTTKNSWNGFLYPANMGNNQDAPIGLYSYSNIATQNVTSMTIMLGSVSFALFDWI